MEGTRIYKNFHQWLIPSRAVVGILALASVFVLVGIVLLVIGSTISTVIGALLFTLGLLLVLSCFLLCLHACFVMYVKDQSTQTQDNDINTSSNSKRDSDQIPTYAFIDKKPPPSPSSIHNGRVAPKKFVTIGGYASQNNADLGSHNKTTPEYGTAAHENNRFNSKYPTQQQQQFQQGPQRVAQQSYAFPMNSSHPTPYSTLKQQQNQRQQPSVHQQQQQQYNDIQQSNFGFNSYTDDMDYDNPVETMPLMVEKQQSVHFKTPNDDTFEPKPLVYPSARRPITFEQMSSSKMSIYDNVQFGLDSLKQDRDND